MSNSLVTVRDLHKVFHRGGERIDVLQGVNLDIPSGDYLALMGPSGSGKTTLLNLMGGLDTPTEGSISVAGDRIDKMSGGKLSQWRARHIGFVFQLYNLLPVLTAARNVELPLLLTKLAKADRMKRVQVALTVVGLADRMNHYPRQLSGGQEQRVGIARAIVTDPTLLLCDEPTGDLDRKAGQAAQDVEGGLDEDLGLGPRHEDAGADREGQVAEGGAAGEVLQRHPAGALVDEGRVGVGRLASAEHQEPARLRDVQPQGVGGERARHVGCGGRRRPPRPRPLGRRADRRRAGRSRRLTRAASAARRAWRPRRRRRSACTTASRSPSSTASRL